MCVCLCVCVCVVTLWTRSCEGAGTAMSSRQALRYSVHISAATKSKSDSILKAHIEKLTFHYLSLCANKQKNGHTTS